MIEQLIIIVLLTLLVVTALGISTILLLGAMSHTTHVQKPMRQRNWPALFFVFCTGALLIYGSLDLPSYGDANSPAQQHPQMARYFLEHSGKDIDIPNVVTSVLASYRGYDTLGETVVVFTAGIAVLSLLGRRRRHNSAQSLLATDSHADDDDEDLL